MHCEYERLNFSTLCVYPLSRVDRHWSGHEARNPTHGIKTHQILNRSQMSGTWALTAVVCEKSGLRRKQSLAVANVGTGRGF